MDALISVVLGVVALIVVVVWIMMALGIGGELFDPLVGVLGAPFLRLSGRISAARRQRSIEKLPPDVPPPPSAP